MLPLQIQRYLPDQQELLPVPLVNFIYHFVPHIIYSLWICTFAITKFINKIMRNQIQYRYILTQVVSGWVMPSDSNGDCQLKLACLDSQHPLDSSIAQCPRNAFQLWRRFFCRPCDWLVYMVSVNGVFLAMHTNFVYCWYRPMNAFRRWSAGKNRLHCIRPWMIKVGELCVAFIYKNANID
jgi:hypothetical protein